MTRKEFTISILLSAALLVLLGIAGAQDAREATICEMQNNGTYWRYHSDHPDWDEVRMVAEYEQSKRDIAQD